MKGTLSFSRDSEDVAQPNKVESTSGVTIVTKKYLGYEGLGLFTIFNKILIA